MKLEHTQKPDCPACARVQSMYERLGPDFAGMSSRDAAFLIALIIHTIHQLAPDDRAGASFLMDLAGFMSAFQSFEEEDGDKPTVCH